MSDRLREINQLCQVPVHEADHTDIEGKVEQVTHASSAAGHTALLQAAREEFAEHGYAGTSIRSLAERAGISTSMLYHYYASKQQLLEAIVC